MAFFEYGRIEIEYLKNKDVKLGEAIDRIGMIRREVIPDTYSALVNSIVAQQISGKAAETVWERLCRLAGNITPGNIAKLDLNTIQSCGVSFRKAGYIREITEAALSGMVDFKTLHLLSDDEIAKKLIKLPGIGMWTVEMLLIFSLCRPDVVSFNDFGIRKGMMKLYGLNELKKQEFLQYRRNYSPYGTVASFYIWAVASEPDA